LAPRGEGIAKGIDAIAPHVLEAELKEEERVKEKNIEKWTIADKLENSKILAGITAFIFIVSIAYLVQREGLPRGFGLERSELHIHVGGLRPLHELDSVHEGQSQSSRHNCWDTPSVPLPRGDHELNAVHGCNAWRT
jgi:short subunit fatty acids transporter